MVSSIEDNRKTIDHLYVGVQSSGVSDPRLGSIVSSWSLVSIVVGSRARIAVDSGDMGSVSL